MTNDIDATARLDMGHSLRPASQRVRVQLRSNKAAISAYRGKSKV